MNRNRTSCACGFGNPRALALLGIAAGAGWLLYEAFRRYLPQRPGGHGPVPRPDGEGIDPRDAPERPVTGSMTPHEMEENAWGTAAPHVGSSETPPRYAE
ncbi:hypothetical protein ABIE65_000008 [Constrictibacter sp. MBR-5]|jgi:hypothetical protein|uniref:hypothetical protein n=1 Tax=Constrictibacter sp. MBR-5 TaxID=3156467 RepID=UPI0033936462